VARNEFKTEYKKLRNLVPALQERSDITKVEIIEETIRYIDALHHQLASRLHGSDRSQGNSGNSNLSSKREGEPFRSIDPSTEVAARSADSDQPTPISSSSTTSPEQPTSRDNQVDTKALKEAVENIQKLFTVHLLQQEPDSPGGDESPSDT